MRRPVAVLRFTAAALVALALTVASAAWACVPQPLLVVDGPATARAGETVTVRGVNFQGRSEIRLNGIDGPRLATGSGNQFRIRLRVPKVRPGLYVLVGVTREPAGGVGASGSTPLEVVSRRSVAAGQSAPSASTGDPGSAPSSSSGIGALPAAAGGAALLALGALLGAWFISGRRQAQLP